MYSVNLRSRLVLANGVTKMTFLFLLRVQPRIHYRNNTLDMNRRSKHVSDMFIERVDFSFRGFE